jgi:prepilin-type N-terminal cleavage/methylation domain-containing protein
MMTGANRSVSFGCLLAGRGRGFSLIEVLIAVLVLALGLLGLGAIFPVVIAQQRDAFNASQGADAADFAFDMLSNSDKTTLDLSPIWSLDASGQMRLGTPVQNGGGGTRPVAIGANNKSYAWIVSSLTEAASGQRPEFAEPMPTFDVSNINDLERGTWRVNVFESPGDYQFQLPVQSRLYPLPDSGADPRFVWDPVVRRLPGEGVQVAVFVRRIDERIRVPRNYTLSDVLTDDNSVPRLDRAVLPLALDPSKGRQVTDDGRSATNAVYPVPLGVDVSVYEDHLDWLVFDNDVAGGTGFDTSLSALRRVGQQFVDNTGVVRTVVALPEVEAGADVALERRAVVVDPPFVKANASESRNIATRNPDAFQRTTWVKQVVFTPQIPAAVRVYTLTKPRDG